MARSSDWGRTVDTAHPLLEARRVPRDVVVQHQPAELEVDALRRWAFDCFGPAMTETPLSTLSYSNSRGGTVSPSLAQREGGGGEAMWERAGPDPDGGDSRGRRLALK